MSTSDPDFYDAKKFSPEPDEAPTRQRGCFFYGCLISGILALLSLIAIGIITYVLYRTFTEFVEENTATAPRVAQGRVSRARRAWRSRRRWKSSRSPSRRRSPPRPSS